MRETRIKSILFAFVVTSITALALLYSYDFTGRKRNPASTPIESQPPTLQTNQDSASERLPTGKIYRLVCQKEGESRDPSGIVRRDIEGELQTLRTYEEIIRNNPGWSSDQVDEELARVLYTEKRRKRLTGIYDWVRSAMIRFIERQPAGVFSTTHKRQLKKLIKQVTLQLPPPASVYADEPDLLTKNGVYYERFHSGSVRLRVGGAFLATVTSHFNLVFTFAHELGHAIDPCEIRSLSIQLPAYDHLKTCFRKTGLIANQSSTTECGENDQLSETFADWVAVQITAEALRQFATEFDHNQLVHALRNSVRDLCEQDESLTEIDETLHPSPEVRIDRIFGQNPVIRSLLGWPATGSSDKYCSFQPTGDTPK